MNKAILFSCIIIFFLFTSCDKDPASPDPDNPEIVSGTVITADTLSGVLGIDNSPYIIRKKVSVPKDSTLIIKPGVKLFFKSSENEEDFNYDNLNVGMLEVNGYIQAEGKTDSTITFSRANEKGHWGIIFIQSNDTYKGNSFNYCNFEYGNKADGIYIEDPRFGMIMTYNSKLYVENSTVQKSKMDGISCYYSAAYVKDNMIRDNQDEGITCYDTSAEITNNLFQDNIENSILFYNYSEGTIKNNVMIGIGESIGIYNRGISLYKSIATIVNNSISNYNGQGIYIDNFEYINYGSPIDIIISENLITNNFTGINISCRYGIYPIISENTVSNNNSTGIWISLSDDCKIDINENLIENNGRIGIIAQDISELTIKDNIISNNSLEGIYCDYCNHVDIISNKIYMNGNSDNFNYPGLYMYYSESDVINNLIAFNGIGVGLYASEMNLINCDIANNEVGLFLSNINNNLDIKNSIIHNNILLFELADYYSGSVDISYCLVQDSILIPEITDMGNNLLAVDPLFFDTINNNYQLSSGSPCIDKGTNAIDSLPELDLLGNPRIVGSAIDIGAYEYQDGR
ncbi:MAG TPA: right-handed parallel beta-helix repeat-containing protein [Clostridiales bacterium]|nr:right-handed parallel beta-helix repeat-containing protein [Clostridiales bacterium]HQP70934.1 right-handed parallel beta-helix repeat-containing protein [Clostridiales bacterium]